MYSLFNIWLGSDLPVYFDFFARTCCFNKNWKWFLFTDLVQSVKKFNESITFIPYNWDQLYKDCYFLKNKNQIVNTHWTDPEGEHSNLTIWPQKGWPCRLYIAKKYKEIWKDSNFIGTFDCDVLYGDLNSKMPYDIENYDMITGHSGLLHPTNKNKRICFPFTIFNKKSFNDVFNYVEKKENILDANYEFSNFFSKKHKVFAGNNIQPVGESIKFNEKKTIIWEKGKLLINNIEGGFYHFMDEKNNKNFKWNISCLKNDSWKISNNRITISKIL